MDKLRAPDKFNLDARNLADAWKKWKEELIIQRKNENFKVVNVFLDLQFEISNY
jgi:hypothetical protein